jgi:hypothetical protein
MHPHLGCWGYGWGAWHGGGRGVWEGTRARLGGRRARGA